MVIEQETGEKLGGVAEGRGLLQRGPMIVSKLKVMLFD
jgi:hypothetical protein